MIALAKHFGRIGPKVRAHQRPVAAALVALAFVFALPPPARAQHAGGAHGGGGHSYGYGGQGYGGHGYYGYGHYGHGYYGGWGGWWYPWGWYPYAYGAYLSVAPWYYPTYWWDGTPYYRAYDTYYEWNPSAQAYEVVPAPGAHGEAAAGSSGAAAVSTELFAYPMKGQTAAQQSQDRYECHRWAADQTGFDPAQTNGGVPANEAMAKRGEYVRAETACLSGRGYSVK